MAVIFNCPYCGATLVPDGDAAVIECDYCSKPVSVPVEMREPGAGIRTANEGAEMSEALELLAELPFEKALEILQLVRDGKKLFAMQVYRSSIDTTLAEAKAVVDRLEAMLQTRGGKKLEDVTDLMQTFVSPPNLPDSVQRVRRVWRVITFITLLFFLFAAAVMIWFQLGGF